MRAGARPFLSASYAEIETVRNGNFKTQILNLNRTETVNFRTAFPLHDVKTHTERRRNGTKRSVGQKRCVNFFLAATVADLAKPVRTLTKTSCPLMTTVTASRCTSLNQKGLATLDYCHLNLNKYFARNVQMYLLQTLPEYCLQSD